MKIKAIPKLSVLLLLAAVLLHIPMDSMGSIQAGIMQENTTQTTAPCAARIDIDDPTRGITPDALPCSPAAPGEQALIPGGIPFGVKFSTDGVLVVGFCDVDSAEGKLNPARIAGLRTGDVILKLNNQPVRDAKALSGMMEAGGGQPFTVTFTRETEEHTVTVTPAYSLSEGKYKSGIWIRDGGAGIGTVTFIDPDSGLFAGLGHGICDGDTGQLIPMNRGTVMDVTISGIVRGQPGSPGEVKGYFNNEKLGTVFGNTDCGVFGLLSSVPAACGEAVPVAARSEVREGQAEVLCSLDTGTVTHYDVTISAINPTSKSNKCFTVTVTDPDLIAKTGGIVQGMSGSPIIQNGKLIGAVTHVLVNDPTTGYGIFIDNMLSRMQQSQAS